MSTRVDVRNLPFCTTDRSRRFTWSNRPTSVELEPAVAEPQPARAAWPVWEHGTLFGVMAKPRPVRPVWVNGTLSGVMAEQRPAPRLIG